MHNPPHPGEFICEMYFDPFKVSPEMALRLSKAFGRTPESWLAMQDNYDLWQARARVNLDEVKKMAFAWMHAFLELN